MRVIAVHTRSECHLAYAAAGRFMERSSAPQLRIPDCQGHGCTIADVSSLDHPRHILACPLLPVCRLYGYQMHTAWRAP